MKPATPFQIDLSNKIRAYIKKARADGVVAMSVDNLMMCARVSDNLQGAPRGTNARYYYAEIFREICKQPGIAEFIL